MTVYVVVFSLVVLSSLFEAAMIGRESGVFYISKTRKTLNWVVLIVLISVSGTRLLGGTDYLWYEKAYTTTPTFWKFIAEPDGVLTVRWTSTLDVGYLFICSFFKSLGFDFHMFCLISSAFFYTSMYVSLRKFCNNFSIILLVFMAKMFFYDTFISMRQSITIAIFFLSLPLIKERKIVKYLVLCLLCFFIHAGSVIMIPAYFLTYINISKKKYTYWIILFLPFAVLSIFNINIFSIIAPIVTAILSLASKLWAMKAKGYLLDYSSGLSVFYYIEYLTIALLLHHNFSRVQSISKDTDFFIKVFMFIWPLLSLFGSTEIVTREKDYFILSYGFLICYFLHMSNRRYRQLYLVGTIAICTYEFFRFIYRFDAGGMIPYSSWLF